MKAKYEPGGEWSSASCTGTERRFTHGETKSCTNTFEIGYVSTRGARVRLGVGVLMTLFSIVMSLHPRTFEVHLRTWIVSNGAVPVVVEEKEHGDHNEGDVENEGDHLEASDHCLPFPVEVVLWDERNNLLSYSRNRELNATNAVSEILEKLVEVLVEDEVVVLRDAESLAKILTRRRGLLLDTLCWLRVEREVL